ncbi:NAD(P)-binding protein [Backusella circina FSU 941]|nr:NAD(P)-binding protein [Backusella circina FSU 941]
MSQSNNMERTALIMGATGAVGKQVLKEILKSNDYQKVISIGRRNVELEQEVPQERLVQKIVDFDNIEASRDDLKNINDVYCCLGTTRADAGGAAPFKKIDQSYVLNTAKLIAEENKPAGSELSPVHLLYCSSMGASKSSPFLYPKTKGETEDKLANTGFEKVTIVRPAFLETVEPRTRPRLMESVAFSIYAPINNMLNLGGIIRVDTVAKAMHKAAMDATFKPSQASNISKSPIGTNVFLFPNADLYQKE